MIPLTLAEIAEPSIGADRRRCRPGHRWSPARSSSTRARSARAACSSRSPGRRSTGTTTPRRRSPPARSRCSAPARCRTCRRSWSRTRCAAMGRLARAVRRPAAGARPSSAITGSSGKTSTKDLIAQLLGRLGPTVAPAGSFNNELGLPYTVLQADRRHPVPGAGDGRAGVGPPAATCARSRRPDVGVVRQRRRRAHRRVRLGRGDRRRPRASWSRRCRPTGSPCSTPTTRGCAAMAARTRARVVLVGEAPDARVRAERRDPRRARPGRRSRWCTPGGSAPGAAGGRAAATRSATRCSPPPWPRELGMAAGRASADALGDLRLVVGPKDGCLRPCRRCHGHRRLVQRQPGVDGGRAARAGRDRRRAAARSRCSATWPSWVSTSGPATRRSAGWPPSWASTGWSWWATRPRPIRDGAAGGGGLGRRVGAGDRSGGGGRAGCAASCARATWCW